MNKVEQIISIMHRHSVRKVYLASNKGFGTAYAVFADGKRLTDPAPHAAAQRARDTMVAEKIIEIMS